MIEDRFLLSLYVNLARAVEIALLGKHHLYITFTDMERLEEYERQMVHAELLNLRSWIEKIKLPNTSFVIQVMMGPGKNTMHVSVVRPAFTSMVSASRYEEVVELARRVLKTKEANPEPPPIPQTLNHEFEALLKQAVERGELLTYAYNNCLSVAQTIAWLDQSKVIRTEHLAEAIQYQL